MCLCLIVLCNLFPTFSGFNSPSSLSLSLGPLLVFHLVVHAPAKRKLGDVSFRYRRVQTARREVKENRSFDHNNEANEAES